MTITSQAGILGFGPSAGKTQGVTAGQWYRHKATLIDMGIMDDQRLGPPEVGGRPLPTIPYKAGVMVAGGATIHPRLEASVGWLIKGVLGYSSTTSGSGAVKVHTFKIDDTTPSYVPFMGFRKYIPTDGLGANYGLGETYNDCKITSLMLTLPNDGLIQARVDMVGRDFTLEQSPAWGTTTGSAGGWDPIYGGFENYPSIPIGTTPGGYISTPDYGVLPIITAQIGMVNTNLDPRFEKVYGSPFLEDVTIVGRSFNAVITAKWTNPDLYREILTNSASGLQWSSVPFTTPINFRSVSPGNMTGEQEPYLLDVSITEMMLSLQGAVALGGNDAVLLRFAGTALDVTGDYCVFTLRNQYANYTWPT